MHEINIRSLGMNTQSQRSTVCRGKEGLGAYEYEMKEEKKGRVDRC